MSGALERRARGAARATAWEDAMQVLMDEKFRGESLDEHEDELIEATYHAIELWHQVPPHFRRWHGARQLTELMWASEAIASQRLMMLVRAGLADSHGPESDEEKVRIMVEQATKLRARRFYDKTARNLQQRFLDAVDRLLADIEAGRVDDMSVLPDLLPSLPVTPSVAGEFRLPDAALRAGALRRA